MNTAMSGVMPKLLKARQYHSRIFAALMVAVLLVSEPRLGWNLSRNGLMFLGYALIIFGAFGRVYCSAFIGGRKNDTVVRSGPFSVVRNPLYVFSFIALAGVGMQSGMLSITVILLGAFCLYYPKVVAKEEAFLAHKFGEQYAQYTREVPRWIPNLDLWREPEQVECMPKFVRKTMMDASIFFLAMPCFVVISILHRNGILPVWLVLP